MRTPPNRTQRQSERELCARVFLCLKKCDLRAVSRMTDEKWPFYSFSTRKTEDPNETRECACVSAKENRVKERKTQGTRKTEEERHF